MSNVKKLRLFIGLPGAERSHVLHIKATRTAMKSTKDYINEKYNWNVVHYYDVDGLPTVPVAKYKRGEDLPESVQELLK